jgi:hypothetical protein
MITLLSLVSDPVNHIDWPQVGIDPDQGDGEAGIDLRGAVELAQCREPESRSAETLKGGEDRP